MANPVDFEGALSQMLAPVGASPDECSDLPVFRDQRQIVSCWRLSDEELINVARTGVVWLSILSPGMPPVCVSGNSFIEIGGREPIAEPYIEPAKRKTHE